MAAQNYSVMFTRIAFLIPLNLKLTKKHGPDLPLHAPDAAGHQNSSAASAFVSHVPAGCCSLL